MLVMRISIITVCLNSEKTIEQTMNSVLSQKYDDLEYLIIDGASTDGTMEIVEKYREQLSAVISEPDEGLYDAMNKGIALATGDIIGIINSDDWYEPEILWTVEKEFAGDSIDVLHAQMKLVEGEYKNEIRKVKDIEELRYRMILNHPTVFVRKRAYIKYGFFDTRYRICADYELLLRFYAKGAGFKYIERVFANYRVDGLSSHYDMQNVRDAYAVAMEYLPYAPHDQRAYYVKKIKDESKALTFGYLLNQKSDEVLWQLIVQAGIQIDNPIVLFGTGAWGIKMCRWLQKCGITPSCFVDNDPAMWTEEILGIHVISPENIKDVGGTVLIVVRDHSREIFEQLEKMRLAHARIVRWEDLLGNNIEMPF